MNPCLSLCLEGEWAVSDSLLDYGSEFVKMLEISTLKL